jgi:uncharacterized membrane protein
MEWIFSGRMDFKTRKDQPPAPLPANRVQGENAKIMGSTAHSIDVNAPLRAVYNQWTRFEEFPRFTESVAEVRQLSPNTLL